MYDALNNLSSGDPETVTEAVNTLIDAFGMDGALCILVGSKDSELVSNAVEIAYEEYWSSLATDFYTEPGKLGEALAVMWYGIDFFGKDAMPQKGWGSKDDKTSHQNMVKTIQASLGNVPVTGYFGNMTQSALKGWGFRGDITGQKVVNTFLGLWNQQFGWPVENPRVTSAFGPRRVGSPFHRGIDIIGNKGIIASGAGRIKDTGYDELNGWYVIIDHGFGRTTSYCHLESKSTVNKNDIVSRESILGIMGNTGQSFGVHLHFGYREFGIAIDPINNILPYDPTIPTNYPVSYDPSEGTYVNKY